MPARLAATEVGMDILVLLRPVRVLPCRASPNGSSRGRTKLRDTHPVDEKLTWLACNGSLLGIAASGLSRSAYFQLPMIFRFVVMTF